MQNIVEFGISKILNAENKGSPPSSPLEKLEANIVSQNKTDAEVLEIQESFSEKQNSIQSETSNFTAEATVSSGSDFNITESAVQRIIEVEASMQTDSLNSDHDIRVSPKAAVFNEQEIEDLNSLSQRNEVTEEKSAVSNEKTPKRSIFESSDDEDLFCDDDISTALEIRQESSVVEKHISSADVSEKTSDNEEKLTPPIIEESKGSSEKKKDGIFDESSDENGFETEIIKSTKNDNASLNPIPVAQNEPVDNYEEIVVPKLQEQAIEDPLQNPTSTEEQLKIPKPPLNNDKKAILTQEQDEVVDQKQDNEKEPLYKEKFSKSFADIFTLEAASSVTESLDISSYVSDASDADRSILQLDDSSTKSSVISSFFGLFKKKNQEQKVTQDDFMLDRIKRPLKAEIKAPEKKAKKERKGIQNQYANKKEAESIEIPGFNLPNK